LSRYGKRAIHTEKLMGFAQPLGTSVLTFF
jgi:hypothetical protein